MTLSPEDQQRIDALKRFFVLNHTPSDDELGRIVRFAGHLFGVEYAFLTLREDNGFEKLAASHGFDMATIPDDAVFFQREDGPSIPIVVEDATLDRRFAGNPLIHLTSPARLYAGVPLKSSQGFTLGTLAVMDTAAQELNSSGMATLADIGALVEPVLQLIQARREQEAANAALANCQALSDAAYAASSALASGIQAFSDAATHVGPAVSASRVAMFIHATGPEGRVAATCYDHWTDGTKRSIAEPGAVIDYESEGLTLWPQAFAERNAISAEASGPLLSASGAQFIAAIPLAYEDTCLGFVLLDRSSLWSVAELTTLQLVFAPLAISIARTAEKSMPAIAESSPIPIAIVGTEGQIQMVNDAARTLLGPDIGRSLNEIIVLPDLHLLTAGVLKAHSGEIEPVEVRLHGSEGDERHMRILASPIDFDGQAATQLAFVDISDNKRHEASLVAERDQALKATEAKSAFLASMSHEIRTALTSILGNAEFLTDELEDDQLEMAQTILGSSERLLQTLNSVMDMERLEAEGDAPTLSPVQVNRLLLDTVRVFEGQAAKRGLAVICEEAKQPLYAWADEGGLMRVIDNLVSNALKFTEKGGVRLRVASKNDTILLEVQDSGIGMAKEFIPHLFDEFKRENGEPSRSSAGSGLGLALTKRLVDLMGGQISVKSRKGQGSMFRVALRAAPAPTVANGDGIAIQPARTPS